MVPDEILQLIQLALSVFIQVWGIFNPKTPPTAAAMTAHLTSVPGLSDNQKTVIASAVHAASGTAG